MNRSLLPMALLPVALVLGLAGCTAFGPPRDPPKMSSPSHYAAAIQGAQLPPAAGVAQQLVGGARPVPAWWTVFQSGALDALVEEGLRRSPSLAAARGALRAAREQLRSEVGANLLPAVKLQASPTRERALGLPFLPQPTFIENVFVADVSASYTFDFFGASLLADRALARQVQQQAYELESTRRAVAANIVQATINAASLQQQLDAQQRLVAASERRAAQMQARWRLGSASHDDALAAEQQAAADAATLPPVRAQLLLVRHALAVLLGRTPDRAPEALPLDSLQLPASVPVAVPSELLHQRPDILAAEAAVRVSADEAGAAAASMFPTLTLTAAYGRGGFDWSTFTSPAGAIWSVAAGLTAPLFNGGALLARKHQYEALHDVAVEQYRQTVLGAFQNVADTLVALEQDADAVAQAERAAQALAQAQRDAEARAALGGLPRYASLIAEGQYQSARIQSIRARAARLADTAALLVSMGDPPSAGGLEWWPASTRREPASAE
jgi:NodT family efflux transporter outer membrane factor (OMF) lipoprotein